MRYAIFTFICFSFSYSLAQANPMEYFYEGRCEKPDFAALAVFESQNCPRPITIKDYEYYEYKEYQEQVCTSHYKIIRVLDAAFDTLKKEYIEVRENPVFSNFRHRPMLIFGKYNKNGMIQIEKYEETREYFDAFNPNGFFIKNQNLEFGHLVGHLNAVYLLHSIGTPYYNLKNLDSIDMIIYNEYLKPFFKQLTEYAGKSFGDLLLRLILNRRPIKAARIRNGFAALGTIKNVRSADDSKQANFYELSVAIETVFKNEAKIDSNIAIFIDKGRLPFGWGCQPLNSLYEMPFYFLGDSKDGNLFIDSLSSTRDVFVFGDTIYDISMGLPFRELLAYFLPPNMSLEEFEFGKKWERFANSSYSAKIRNGIIPESIASQPECLKKDIIETVIKWNDFFGEKPYGLAYGNKRYTDIESLFNNTFLNIFRCRKPAEINTFEYMDYIDNPNQFLEKRKICAECRYPFISKDEKIWGRKW